MTVRDILAWPDARLRAICNPVAEISNQTRELTGDLFDTMYAARGRGLAAPQIGVLQQVFVMDAGWKQGPRTPLAMINPIITASGDLECDIEEACLSIPGLSVMVRRPAEVSVLWTDLESGQHRRDFDGAEARVIQHEVAHLAGQVIFDEFRPKESAALEARYLAARA